MNEEEEAILAYCWSVVRAAASRVYVFSLRRIDGYGVRERVDGSIARPSEKVIQPKQKQFALWKRKYVYIWQHWNSNSRLAEVVSTHFMKKKSWR